MSNLPVVAKMAERFEMTPAEFERTVRATVCPSNITNEQFVAFLMVAKEYNLNPITIGNALSSLVEEGILHKRRGVGFFVSPDARKLIISMRGKDFLTEKLEPVLKNARQLELPKEQIIQLTERIYGENHE